MKKIATYKPITDLKDTSFSYEKIDRYSLCLQVSMDFLEVLVLDSEEKGILYESYRLDNLTNYTELTALLRTIFESHHCLQAGFWKKVYVGVQSKQFSLVPNELADENLAPLIAFNAPIKESDLILSQEVLGQDLRIAFAFPKILADFLQKYYQNLTFSHQNVGFLAAMQQQPALLNEQYVHLLVHQQSMCLAFFKKGKLQYFNRFEYQSAKDFLYYVLLVYSELHLDRESIALYLYGHFEADNLHVRQLSEYIKIVQLGSKPTTFLLTNELLSLASHEAFDLVGLYQK